MECLNIANSRIELVKGDITTQDTDAIANAANSGLRGGGGVDGAIHRAGGPEIMAECRKIGSCPTGSAVITTAGKLPCKKVIHTVGPVYKGGNSGEAKLLKSAYQSCLEIAYKKNMSSIAFPSISTGVYGYPVTEAATIALKTAADFLKCHGSEMLVRFVLFDGKTYKAFATALEGLDKPDG